MGTDATRSLGKFDLRDIGVIGDGPDRDFDTAVSLAAGAARAPAATFAVLDFEAGLSRLRSHVGLGGATPEMGIVPIEAAITLRAMSESDIIAIPETALDPLARENPFIRAHGIRSLLAAPVLCPAQDVIGLLAVHDRVPRLWTANERAAISGLAHLCTRIILLRAALTTLGIVSRKSKAV